MQRTIFYIILLLTSFPCAAQIGFDDFDYNDSNAISYKVHLVMQYGGESKLTMLPKFNFIRIHQKNLLKPYYGAELGVHPLFVGGAFTFSAITGAELKPFQLEPSFSHFRTTRISDLNGGDKSPYYQNLMNVKLSYTFKRFTLKLGTSLVLSEFLPTGEDPLPLFELGVINNQLYGLELQYRIN